MPPRKNRPRASINRPNKSRARGSGARPRSSTRPDIRDNGIAVSIGPAYEGGPRNKWVKKWMTLPLTPEVIPISVSGSWADGQFTIDGGENSSFIGPALDTIAFAGRLEPPSYYLAWGSQVSRQSKESGFLDPVTQVGQINQGDYLELGQFFTVGHDVPTGAEVRVPYFQDGTGVVMEEGARPGPAEYIEPHAFKEILARACRAGEVVHLVVGDEFGWDSLATIREFSWRFEDPDPDVLLFDITFREWREADVDRVKRRGGKKGGGKKGARVPRSYTTQSGDSLHSVAIKYFREAQAWRRISDLNEDLFERLHYFRPGLPGVPKRGMIAPKNYKGLTGSTPLGPNPQINPDTHLGAGIRLRLRRAKKD